MGGTNEETISGLRVHLKNGDVHLHDDDKNLKFKMESSEFKEEIEDAFKEKNDGVVVIPGDGKNSLCILKTGRTLNVFLKDNTSIKPKLKAFISNC